MSLLSRLLGRSQKSEPSVPEVRICTPRRTEARRLDARRQPRVSLNSTTQFFRKGFAPVSCTIVDASTEGLRLIVDEPVAPNTTVGVVVHFNGCFLRLRALVVRCTEHGGRYEVGATQLPSLIDDGGLKDQFARYITWKVTACAA